MIDIENEVFNDVAIAVRNEFPKAYVIGEYVKSPPKFPCVSLVEMDNSARRDTQTSEELENHSELLYQLDVYSNRTSAKKSECKEIIALADERMAAMGFRRTMLQPVPNIDDATVYRMTARYVGVVSKNRVIYRR